MKAQPVAARREPRKRGTAKRPDDLVKSQGVELTELN